MYPPAMSTNTDTTNQSSGGSNTTLIFIIIAVVFGVMSYILIRYGSSLISEWRQHLNGGVTAQAPTLGLGPSDIEAFPTFIYRGATRNGNGDSDDFCNHSSRSSSVGDGNGNGMGNSKRHGVLVDCSICLCDLQEDDVVRMLLPCRHFFHIQCIDVWLYAHPSCPTCRAILQTESVALTECSMSPPLPQLHRCNNSEGADEANIQSTTEEITTSGGITEIVVEQNARIAGNMDISSTSSTSNESLKIQFNVNDKVDKEMHAEQCSDKSTSTNEALPLSNIGSPSKRMASLGPLQAPMVEEMQEGNQEILETTTVNDSLANLGKLYSSKELPKTETEETDV